MDRGETLHDRLRYGRLTDDEVFQYARQIAQQLDVRHRSGLTFGDVSPETVRIHADGRISIEPSESAFHAPDREFAPSRERLPYLAPEILRGQIPDQRSDVYSFGAVLYEMLTGQPPYHGRSEDYLTRILYERRSESYYWILNHSLAADPERRLPASAFVDALSEYGSVASLPGPIPESIPRSIPFPPELDVDETLARALAVMKRVAPVIVGVIAATGIAVLLLRTVSCSRPPIPALSASTPAALYSATWFSTNASPRTSVNLADEAQAFLRVNVPYTLKFAIQDSEFPAPPIPDPSYRREQIPSGGLQPGDTLEVSYFSTAFEPSLGRTSIEVAPRGQTAVASFGVLPISSASDSSPVRLDVRFKGLPFYAAVLHPVIIGKGQDPPPPRPPSWTRGAHAVAPAAAANYADRRAADVRILVTPSQGDSRFSILIERPGMPGAVQGKSGLTPNELRDRLTLVRSEIEKLRRDKVFEGALNGDRVEPTVRQHLLRKLAELGWNLYRDVFKDDSLQTALATIREDSLKNPGMRVLIEHATADDPAYPKRMLLPFGLLYDDPAFKLDEKESAPVDVKHFWDYRYLLEVTDYRMMYWRGSFCLDNAPMRLAAVMDVGAEGRQTAKDWREEVESQKKTITALFGGPALFVPDEQNFRQIFRGQSKPFDLVYFYGHTNSGPNPAFDLTGQMLTIDQVREDARQNAENRLKDHPVVILNSCRGAAFSGDTTNTFLDVMADLKSSAFVATEASIGIGFGATVGERLLRALSTGKSGNTLLEVIWRMKHDALDNQDGNPMMLLYSVFGDPFVKVCSPKP